MSFDFGNFAGGVAKTWDSKAIGGAINQGMLNQDVQAAEDKAKEDQAALEHLRKAQAEKGHRVQDDTGEMFTYGASRTVDDDWIKKQQERSANNRTEAIKTAYTKWKSPEAYNNYLKSEAEGSKADFEKMFTDTKMSLTKKFQLWDSGTPEGNQAMFAEAQKQGLVPAGATFDPKAMTLTMPGQNGVPVVKQITPDMINSTRDALQLGCLKGLFRLDPAQRKAISDMHVAEKTEGDRIRKAGLENDQIVNNMENNNRRTAAIEYNAKTHRIGTLGNFGLGLVDRLGGRFDPSAKVGKDGKMTNSAGASVLLKPNGQYFQGNQFIGTRDPSGQFLNPGIDSLEMQKATIQSIVQSGLGGNLGFDTSGNQVRPYMIGPDGQRDYDLLKYSTPNHF